MGDVIWVGVKIHRYVETKPRYWKVGDTSVIQHGMNEHSIKPRSNLHKCCFHSLTHSPARPPLPLTTLWI